MVKKDGTHTLEHSFNTRQANLEGVSFEVVGPGEQLDDILKKRQNGKELKPKREQDIENLKRLLGLK